MGYIADSDYTKNVLATLNAARIAGIACVLWGSPGTGKTELVKELGRRGVEDKNAPGGRRELPVKILLGSIMDPTDLAGLPAIQERVDAQGRRYQVTENTRPDWADDLISNGEGILFLDELNNATPTMQSAELSLLQGRQVGQSVLPDNVWILAASNEPEDAADGHDLTPPMANRLLHIKWAPPASDWIDGMFANWGETDANKRHVHEIRIRIASFLRDHIALIQDQPDNDAAAGKAWASRRSWDNAAKGLAEVEDNNVGVRNLILKGLVGDHAATQFFMWEKTLALPSNEAILSDPESINWKEMKVDAVYTIVKRLTAFVNEENVDDALKAMLVIRETNRDIIVTEFLNFLKAVKKQGIDVSRLGDTMKVLVQDVTAAQLNKKR